MGKLIPFAEYQAQQKATARYLNAFGQPRLEQPDEGSGFVVIGSVLACAVISAAAWLMSVVFAVGR